MNLFFRGNANLKRVGTQIEYTKEQIQEYVRCSEDPIYFIKKYIKIINLDRGLIPFEMYDYQEKFIECLHNNKKIISMQPRQSGKTISVAAYLCWYITFSDDKNVAILANKASAAREIMSRLQKAYENLPKWIQSGVKTWNKGSLELENGCKVFIAATNSTSVTGQSINLLYVDEVSRIPNTMAEDFFTSAYPTLSSGIDTKIILTSTPKGYNHFWSFWSKAESKDPAVHNGFVPFRVYYYNHPDRDEKWAKEQLVLLGQVKFNQEILCDFVGSSLSLISGDYISRMVMSPYVYSKDGLDVLETSKQGHTYVVTADTSKGVGGDYSALTVVDITELPYSVVAKYRDNKISPILYPSIIQNIAKNYNNAFVLLERNSSEQVGFILQSELEYENILYVGRDKSGQYVSSGFGSKSQDIGVNTDKKVKRIGCNNLKTLIEENKLLIADTNIIAELSTFIENRGTYAADDGYHDDLVMTLVLFAWLTTNSFFKELTNSNLRQELYDKHLQNLEEQMIPIGFYETGNSEEEKGTIIGGDYWVTAEPVDTFWN